MRIPKQFKYKPDWWAKVAKGCPLCYKLFFSERHEYKKLKTFLGFLYGVFLGFGLYKLVISQLGMKILTAYIISGIMTIFLGIGCAVSSQMRCTTLLTFPSFGSKAGRSTLRAMVIAYILAGPVANLTVNAGEVIRTFACTTSLTYNLTRTRFILMFKPFQTALMNLRSDTSEVKDTLASIKGVVEPIREEIEDKNEIDMLKEENDYVDESKEDTKRSEEIDKKYNDKDINSTNTIYEEEYFRKMEYRCNNVVSSAESNCKQMFAKAYDSCYDRVPWGTGWILCWPMKLTFICNVMTSLGGDNVCDPSRVLPHGFGYGYVYVTKAKGRFAEEFKSGRIQYRMTRPKIPLDLRGARDTAQAVMREFQQKRSFMENIVIIIKRILVFVFIRIILNAQNYHEQYIKDIEAENKYITKYFKKIDARRHKNGQHTLLPLKKIEKKKLIDPYTFHLHPSEMGRLTSHTIKLILEMLTATTIILIDRVFFETLALIKHHSRIDYEQTGHHILIITVKGTGLIASIVRSLVSGFNIRESVHNIYSNLRCLPNPKVLDFQYIRDIYGLYIIVLILTILEGYSTRIRWLICSYFYPKQEKKRVLHLYNATLKARIGFFKYMRGKVLRMVKQNKLSQDMSILLMIRLKYRKQFGWLSWFSEAKRKCLICGELEPRSKAKQKKNFYECPGCLYIYCNECWADIDETCYVCTPPPPDVLNELQELDDIEVAD